MTSFTARASEIMVASEAPFLRPSIPGKNVSCVPTGVKYDFTINPCHAEYFHILHSSPNFYPVNLQRLSTTKVGSATYNLQQTPISNLAAFSEITNKA